VLLCTALVNNADIQEKFTKRKRRQRTEKEKSMLSHYLIKTKVNMKLRREKGVQLLNCITGLKIKKIYLKHIKKRKGSFLFSFSCW